MGAAESGRAAAGPTSAAGSRGGFSSNQTPLRLKASGALFTGGSGASAFSTVAAAEALVFFAVAGAFAFFDSAGLAFACGDFGRDLAFAFFGSAGLAFACGDFGRDLAFGSVRRLSASTILRRYIPLYRLPCSCEELPPTGARPSSGGSLPACRPACSCCASGPAGGQRLTTSGRLCICTSILASDASSLGRPPCG